MIIVETGTAISIPEAIKGCGVLREMLDLIGSDRGDADVAKIMADNEQTLWALLNYALNELASA